MSGGQDWANESQRENITLEQWEIEQEALARRTDPVYAMGANLAPANPGQRSPSEELAAIDAMLSRWTQRHQSDGEPFMRVCRIIDHARDDLALAIQILKLRAKA
jgi:hypothetical protein